MTLPTIDSAPDPAFVGMSDGRLLIRLDEADRAIAAAVATGTARDIREAYARRRPISNELHRRHLVQIRQSAEASAHERFGLKEAIARETDRFDALLLTAKRMNGKTDVTVAQRVFHKHREDVGTDDAPRLAAHVDRLLEEHHIRRVDATHHRAGVAWSPWRLVRIPPVRSGFTCATALHEIAHVLNPCNGHERVPAEDGGTVCVECEITAWRWAIRHAPDGRWVRDMQESMATGLTSYRGYGTPSQQQQIDGLLSPAGFRLAQMEADLSEQERRYAAR